MRLLFAAFAGGLFGLGLLVAGMLDTARVQGFLDLGAWDPTLAFVMGGAILPMAVAWRLARPVSLLGTPTPERLLQVIDARLLVGSVLFGAGWALAGLCPGPAVAVLGFGGLPALTFFVAMAAGMIAARVARVAFRPA
jgi:uncharacterized membrane protein YedE/YeeE